MPSQTANVMECPDCRTVKFSFFARYRDFLLSKETIIAFINGVLLLAGFIASVAGSPEIGKWLYFASAVIGGIPLFMLAARAVFIHHDITAGFMASVAMIAAILVGEYSAAALVVFMFAIGDWLENLTIARADNALRDLAKLVPTDVIVLRDGQEYPTPIDRVRVGDHVLVRSGERIGVDGQIIQGAGSINQSAITGESIPVEKKAGDEVFAGTLNEVGAIEIEVKRTGQDTTLGQIVKLVKDAQKTQAPVQRIANKYARILVPVTFGIAILVYLLTSDITRSITVLVVVCPCALVLATPTAVVAAIGNAARRGMLVKSGAVIEQIGKVDVVAFDKTGTLTYGRPVVQEVISLDGVAPDQILSLAAATEIYSEHPIGRSIVQASRERQLSVAQAADFSSLPGYGVTAQVENRQVIVGNRALLADRGIQWHQDVDERAIHLENQGYTVIPVVISGNLSGLITLADTPREEAKKAIAQLKRIGIQKVIMITGDNRRTAERIAKELGVDHVYADVLPQDKLSIIRELQSDGKNVAFVGDGVNDAPALAAADIGIAMGLAGTDVALEAADIGLMADEIERIPQIIDLSRHALRVILQNVIFSMSMNVLSVALGGLGIIGPALGALMHETSALPVLANSARLVNHRDRGKVTQ
ncbi:MAG TPA: cation-translocating P-type ATPase [Anaerolineaceae bacterium]|nr:cation-translocating P-type ATPase [Anaerolineaceae bacterium]